MLDPQIFKSVIVFLQINKQKARFTINIDELVDWICRYDVWWKDITGITSAKNLHLLYNRSISVTGSGVLAASASIGEIAEASKRAGMAFTLKATIDDMLDYEQQLLELARSSIHNIIIGYSDGEAPRADRARTNGILTELAKLRLSITLTGAYSSWSKTGVFDLEEFDSTTFQLIPNSMRSSRSENSNHVRRDRPPQSERIAHSDPCRNRFRIFIAPDGRIYPCNGLMGNHKYSLGELADPISELGENYNAQAGLDIDHLAAVGPGKIPIQTAAEFRELPQVCAAHRIALSNEQNVE